MAASLTITRFLSSAALSFPTTTKLPPKSLSMKHFISPLSLNHHRRRPSKPISFSTKTTQISAAISVGDKLPDATLSYFDSEGELQSITISSLTAEKSHPLRRPGRMRQRFAFEATDLHSPPRAPRSHPTTSASTSLNSSSLPRKPSNVLLKNKLRNHPFLSKTRKPPLKIKPINSSSVLISPPTTPNLFLFLRKVRGIIQKPNLFFFPLFALIPNRHQDFFLSSSSSS